MEEQVLMIIVGIALPHIERLGELSLFRNYFKEWISILQNMIWYTEYIEIVSVQYSVQYSIHYFTATTGPEGFLAPYLSIIDSGKGENE